MLKKKIFIQIFKFLFASLILWWLFNSKRIDLNSIQHIDNPNFKWIFFAILILPFQGIIASIRWFQLQKIRGFSLTLIQCIKLTFIGIFFNICLPGGAGGDIVKITLVTKETIERKVEAGTIIIIDRVIGMFSLLLIGGFASIIIIIFSPYNILFYKLFSVICIFICFTFLVLALFFKKKLYNIKLISYLKNRFKILKIFGRIYYEIHAFRNHYCSLLTGVILSIINHGVGIFTFYFIGRSLNDSLNFLKYFIFTPIVFISNLLPLTPGGIGIAEATSSFLWKTSGATMGGNTMLIFRLLLLTIAFILGLPSWILWKTSNSKN